VSARAAPLAERRGWLDAARRQPAMVARIALSYLLLTLAAAVVLVPVAVMVGTAGKAPGEATANLGIWPREFTWSNFVVVWQTTALLRMMANSALVAIASTLTVLGFGALAGYAFSRMQFLLKEVFFVGILLGIMLPAASVVIPLFLTVKTYGLLNSYWGLIGPYAAFGLPLAVLVLRNFFDALPGELIDAARVDGASHLAVFWRIALPLSTPALATVAIFQALTSWNEFLLALLFMTRAELRTVPLAYIVYYAQFNINWEKTFAVLTIVTVPILLLYIALQKQFIRGLTAGALKG